MSRNGGVIIFPAYFAVPSANAPPARGAAARKESQKAAFLKSWEKK
jgi:hypothetical protein